MPIERISPPFTAPDREMLESWLDFHRATLLLKCEGVPPKRLAEQTVAPSTLSLLGLVRHMVDVELNWFQRVLKESSTGSRYSTPEEPDADFENLDAEQVADAFEQFRITCDLSRESAAEIEDLDWRTNPSPRGHAISLRWIYVHMIEEYARHNGHADLIRQRIDGVTGV